MANIIVPRRRQEWFDPNGEFSHQALRFFEELTELTNNTSNDVSGSFSAQSFSAHTEQLQRRLDGLPTLTIDTTGFTVDTTLITTDKVIA